MEAWTGKEIGLDGKREIGLDEKLESTTYNRQSPPATLHRILHCPGLTHDNIHENTRLQLLYAKQP
jgi:hypothetical protein